jgi:hypothetical protein
VLIQQTSNWLLRQWSKVREGEGVASPYSTVDFLTNAADILKKKFTGRDLQDVTDHSCKYKQTCLIVYLLYFFICTVANKFILGYCGTSQFIMYASLILLIPNF